jgi:hypothetical protein
MYNIVWSCVTNKNWIWKSPEEMFWTQYVMTRCLIDNSCYTCQKNRQSRCSRYISTHLLKQLYAYHPHQKAVFFYMGNRRHNYLQEFSMFSLCFLKCHSRFSISLCIFAKNPIVFLTVLHPQEVLQFSMCS